MSSRSKSQAGESAHKANSHSILHSRSRASSSADSQNLIIDLTFQLQAGPDDVCSGTFSTRPSQEERPCKDHGNAGGERKGFLVCPPVRTRRRKATRQAIFSLPTRRNCCTRCQVSVICDAPQPVSRLFRAIPPQLRGQIHSIRFTVLSYRSRGTARKTRFLPPRFSMFSSRAT